MDRKERDALVEQATRILMQSVHHRDFRDENLNFFQDDIKDEAISIDLKIDILERMLEILRIHHKYLDTRLTMETFIQGKVDIDADGLHFTLPASMLPSGSGTAPIRLQPKLLAFLLFRNNDGFMKIYDIIDNFIKIVWDQLEALDFKKTQTGVTRCFTNTRFAANTLRDYGLIKFTREEAYKTWILSLPGILVASKVIEQKNWLIPRIPTPYISDLHPNIRDAFDDLKTVGDFVKRLATVCRPDTKAFNEFAKGKNAAYRGLEEYWKVLKDEKKNKEERKKASTEILRDLESDKDIIAFHNELARCIKVGDLLTMKIG
jgi:hypothetical protein